MDAYIDEVTGELVHVQVTEAEPGMGLAAATVDENGEFIQAEVIHQQQLEEQEYDKSLSHFISLIQDFDSATVLQAVGPKLFDHFTIWDLLMAKSNLHLDKGVLNVVVHDIIVALSELKLFIEQCLDPVIQGEVAIKKRSGESVKFDQMITSALGLNSNLWMKRDVEDIKYPHIMFSPKHLFSDKSKKDTDFSRERIKKEIDATPEKDQENVDDEFEEENEDPIAAEEDSEPPTKKVKIGKSSPTKKVRTRSQANDIEDEDDEPPLDDEEKMVRETKKIMAKIDAEDPEFEPSESSDGKKGRKTAAGSRKNKRKKGKGGNYGVEEIEKKGDYICGKCGKTYLNFTAWYKHMEKSCASRASLRVSIRTVGQKYYCAYPQCATPKRPFRTKDDVHDHWSLLHVEESKKIIPCFMCSLKFATVGAKKLHMNKVHVKPPPAKKKEEVEITEDDGKKGKGEKYLCLKCGQSMNKDRGKKHEERCNGMYVRRPEYKKVNDEYFCTVEGCNIGFGFSSMYGLRKHFHGIHTSEEEKFFLCDYCDEKFSFKTMRNKHITEKHLKKYVCDLCGKGFGGRSSMMQHRILHTGEKPFACTSCDYRAAKKSNLEAHMESKHNIFRQKNFMCAICNKQFVTMGRVQRHMSEIHGEGADEKRRRRGRAPPGPLELESAQIMEEMPNQEGTEEATAAEGEEQGDEATNIKNEATEGGEEEAVIGEEIAGEVEGVVEDEEVHRVLVPVVDGNEVVEDQGQPVEGVEYIQAEELDADSETIITVKELLS